jgi:ATP-binding cassette subfamily B protein
MKQTVVLIRDCLRLLRHSGWWLTISSAVVTALEVVASLAALYFIKIFIDSVSAGDAGTTVMDTALFWLLPMVGSLLLSVLMQSLSAYLREMQGLRVSKYVDGLIHDRAISVDMAFYESPLYFDSLYRARQSGVRRPAQVIDSVILLLRSIAFLIAVLLVLAAVEWRILPALVVVSAAMLVVRLKFTRRLFDWQKRRAQMERRASYMDWLITSDHHAKEMRLSNLGGHFRRNYGELRQDINEQQLGIERSRGIAEFFVLSLGVLVFAGVAVLLIQEALAGRQSFGNLAVAILLFRRAENSGRDFVSNLSKLFDHRLFLQQLFDFLEIKPRIKAPAHPRQIQEQLSHGVEFHNVSFSYPTSSKPVIKDLNLSVGPGQIVALVGENGSGKTSLIKLLVRLHDPSEGKITLDGVDVREFDPQDYRRLFSVIFQDFARYAASARENIWYGDVAGDPYGDRVWRASDLAGASEFIKDLPGGWETPLSRMFDNGSELSIGQWQRLALARAFFPQSRFIVMDEPTSAIDPRAEAELFDSFRDKLDGRGALVISHRLSTIRMADYIYVLKEGRVSEAGTHDDLLRRSGTYASLFETQARYYRE